MPTKRVVFRVVRFGDRQVKVKWVLPAYILIFAIAYGLFIAYSTYAHDRAKAAEFAAAEAKYEAEVTAYDNCHRRVESRTEIRGMFQATFDTIESGTGPSQVLAAVRERLDERYPALDDAECIRPGPRPEE